MPRPPRIIDPNGVYHVYSRGNNRSSLFRDDFDYRQFNNIMLSAKKRYGFSLFNYVWMPNHVHLLIHPNNMQLPEIMRDVKVSFARYFGRKYGFVGHVWEKRYQNKTIGSDEYLFACGNYIEMNPIRAGLVASPENWPYSSFGFYAFGAGNPLVDENPFYVNVGRTDDERRSEYRRVVSMTRAG